MVEEELGDLKEAVEKLRELISTEHDLHVRTDNNFMLRHLRAADGDPEKAFIKVRCWYIFYFHSYT